MRLLFVPFHVTVVLFRVTPSAGHVWLCSAAGFAPSSVGREDAERFAAVWIVPTAHFISQVSLDFTSTCRCVASFAVLPPFRYYTTSQGICQSRIGWVDLVPTLKPPSAVLFDRLGSPFPFSSLSGFRHSWP
eukprot:GHVS01073399.1.p2 GENE.GHVS01073399.1~~GHVS01073399.1.p2  ORF type:complete len:132 (-),score=19.76 GHVS01073399.1:1032-1427(-)